MMHAQAQSINYMPNGVQMGGSMMNIHPSQMAQFQAMQARQMAQRQVGPAPYSRRVVPMLN